ncbi:MAG: hypothetical protein JWO46_1222 [Nocardioidaceae bacterium]|nr:hypothetical protein [Nocardioidaceae bacterium]
MPDAQFADPRLARVYDALDPDRRDLAPYVGLAAELGARRILDVGCGTGSLALLLAAEGYGVTGLDPAEASLDVARAKPGAEDVRWLHGDAAAAPPGAFDLAVMTGNVAQVFVTDEDWAATLAALQEALVPRGHLVFETRRPEARGWEAWTPDSSRHHADVPGVGVVETWVELTEVTSDLVSFRWTYLFHDDGSALFSDSTLRFRDEASVRRTLEAAGFDALDVREAPDRPGKELVFVTQRR